MRSLLVDRDRDELRRVAALMCVDTADVASWHLFHQHSLTDAVPSLFDCKEHCWSETLTDYVMLP